MALERGRKPSSMTLYRGFRGFLRRVVAPYVNLRSENGEVLELPGPTILAPVHRSHLDSVLIATLTSRRIRALGKESLFTTPGVGYICAALGAIPVKRGAADKDAMKAALGLLNEGETMIVFPEGGRQHGNQVATLFDGAAWLASRTGARVVPIGVAGTEDVLPQGAKRIHRADVAIVVADPMELVGNEGRRPDRQQLQTFTEQLRIELQKAQDRAVELAAKS